MASKNKKSIATGSKADDSKTSGDAAHTHANPRVVGPMTRSMTKAHAQSNMEGRSASTPIFGSIPSEISSPVLGLKDVGTSIERTLAMLEAGTDTKASMHDDDMSSSGSASSHGTPYSRSLFHDDFATSTAFSTMPAMMTQASSLEEQMANMTKMMERMMKHIQDQDTVIAQLVSQKDDTHEASQISSKAPVGHKEPETSSKQYEKMKEVQISSDGTIPVDQLREVVEGMIKVKYEGVQKSSLTYAKPYTARIDSLMMPAGYQPPKFQQFDGKGNPKQHVAHFVETCNNAGTYGDFLVKQFVRSLKGNAFDWYTDLEPSSINSWDQLEQEFLNRFYSTRRTVSMLELTTARQWKDEPVVDYIDRWRTLSLNCKDRFLRHLL